MQKFSLKSNRGLPRIGVENLDFHSHSWLKEGGEIGETVLRDLEVGLEMVGEVIHERCFGKRESALSCRTSGKKSVSSGFFIYTGFYWTFTIRVTVKSDS